MTVFFVGTCLLVLLAIVAILLAFRHRDINALTSSHQRIVRNVSLYKQRLGRLEKDLDEGLLSEEDFSYLHTEQARELIAATEKLEGVSESTSDKSYSLVVLLMTALLLIVISSFYYYLGSLKDWQIHQSIEALKLVRGADEYKSQSEALATSINKRLEAKPDDIDYRFLLASFAMGQQDYQEAALHYGVIAELLPEDAQAQAFFAQALYLKGNRQIDVEVAEAMDRTLAIDPTNTTVLGMQGISAFESGDYIAAIESWSVLLEQLPANDNQRQLIATGIEQAKLMLTDSQRQQLGIEKVNDQPGIWVEVSLSEELKTLDESLTVFIFAKAADGPKLPLAVKRILVRDLPVKVQLSDALAMTPQFKLSSFPTVDIGARVSFSGQPIAAKGDWFDTEESVNWKERELVKLIIDRQVQ